MPKLAIYKVAFWTSLRETKQRSGPNKIIWTERQKDVDKQMLRGEAIGAHPAILSYRSYGRADRKSKLQILIEELTTRTGKFICIGNWFLPEWVPTWYHFSFSIVSGDWMVGGAGYQPGLSLYRLPHIHTTTRVRI